MRFLLIAAIFLGAIGSASAKQASCEASYYGFESCRHHHACRTADGRPFNPNRFGAAHRTLPFGTHLDVTNLHNGRHVVVVVNDRGPAAWTGRCLDLARGAAAALGFIPAGTTRVAFHIVGAHQMESNPVTNFLGRLFK